MMDPIPDLYETPGDRLDYFLEHCLQPERDWKEEGQDAWDRIEGFLRDQCFRGASLLGQEIKVLKVVKVSTNGPGFKSHLCPVGFVMDLLQVFTNQGGWSPGVPGC